MKKQKMKLLLISLFLIGTVSSCENVVNNNTEKDPLNESLSIESDTKINNPLANKKFYYLYKDEDDYEYDYIYKGQATPYLYRFLNKL